MISHHNALVWTRIDYKNYTCMNRDTIDKEAVWCNIQDIYDMILQCCLEYFKDNIE